MSTRSTDSGQETWRETIGAPVDPDATTADGSRGAGEPVAPARPEPEARYVAGQELGRGALGRVEVVTDRVLEREVARKVLVRHSPTHQARFAREARVTARLEHPNIVPVHDAGRTEDGSAFYVMKYIRGRSLREALEGCPSLGERLALLDHFGDVCQAVGFAHSRGVIHRDLKPDNVMVGAFGETQVVDWGLARVLDEADVAVDGTEAGPTADTSLTRVGAVLGTPAYMSPEQARGEEADARSDVYSLGAILHELLTGRPPYTGASAEAVIAAVAAGGGPSVRQAAPDAPPELAAIADKALARRPGERYADAAALARDVQLYLSGRTVSAYRYSRSELVRRFVGAYRVPLLGVAGGLAIAAVTAVVASLQVLEQRDEAVVARHEAEVAERKARETLAAALSDGARAAMGDADPVWAALHASEATVHAPSPVARGVLSWAVQGWSPRLESRIPLPARCYAVEPLPDGAFACLGPDGLLVLDGDGTVRWSVDDAAGRSLDLHPDGTRLAAGLEDLVRVYRLADGTVAHERAAQQSLVAWSADGRLAWSDSGTAWIDDQAVTDCGSFSTHLAWAEDLLVHGCVSGLLVGIDREGRRAVELRVREASYAARVDPSAGVALMARQDELDLVDLADGSTVWTATGDGQLVGVDWSPDRRWVAAMTELGTLHLYDARDGTQRASLPAAGAGLLPFYFTDAHTLVASDGTSLRRWHLPELPPPARIEQGAGISDLATSDLHDRLVVVDGGGRITLFDGATRAAVAAWSTSRGARAAFTDEALWVLDPTGLLTWHAPADGAVLRRVDTGSEPAVTLLPWGPDVVALLRDGAVVRLTPEGVAAQLDEGPAVAVDAQGGHLLVFGGQGVRWLDRAGAEVRRRALPDAERIFDAAVSRDGRWLAWVGTEPVVRLLDLHGDAPPARLEGHRHRISHLVWSADGLLISTAWDRTARVWRGEELLAVLEGHGDRLGQGGLLHDHVVSSAWDGEIRSWALQPLREDAVVQRDRIRARLGYRVGPAGVEPLPLAASPDGG